MIDWAKKQPDVVDFTVNRQHRQNATMSLTVLFRHKVTGGNAEFIESMSEDQTLAVLNCFIHQYLITFTLQAFLRSDQLSS
jgi:hypothetical protein